MMLACNYIDIQVSPIVCFKERGLKPNNKTQEAQIARGVAISMYTRTHTHTHTDTENHWHPGKIKHFNTA